MAVYTEVSDSALIEYLKNYQIGELHSFKGIAEGVENSNYFLSTDAGSFILTLYEKRVNKNDLPFFLGLMEHFANKGMDCPLPVKMISGEMLGTLAGRPAAIITFLDGFSVRKPKAIHCLEVGRGLAKMHMAGKGFKLRRKNALTLENWRPLFNKSANRANEVAQNLDNFIASELEFLENTWPNDLPIGVVHADLFTDNVFFIKDKLSGIIDFYFACNDILAYDLATCINAWCFEPDGSFNATKAIALIRGYEEFRPLSNAEFEQLPILARGSALRFLLTRLYDWLNVPEGAMVTPKDPGEYITKLKFHQKIKSSSGYGLPKRENR